MYIRLVVLRLW